MNNKKLVVLSGGQDSATCLGLALSQAPGRVHAITFSYGQRHACELAAARALCMKHHVPQKVVGLDFVPQLVTSALTGPGDVCAEHPEKAWLPASFVPGRNALFLTLAHAYAQTIGADQIITGVCQTDYSGYPDCRDLFVRKLESALNTGYDTNITISTPLMHVNKAGTFALAADCGFLLDVLLLSHTCYNGDHSTFHEWGYGCGHCPACKLRRDGWMAFAELNPDVAAQVSGEAMRSHLGL